jgi:hypothetical protein
MRYGMLTVVADAGFKSKNKYVVCNCDCGNKVTVRFDSVKRGDTSSCGCLRRKTATKHGMASSRLYSVWNGMVQRCTNPNNRKYSDYGGRGITVDPSWLDFITFSDFAMRNGYTDSLCLDRINNDGPYQPGNVRFVSVAENNRNRRNSVKLDKVASHQYGKLRVYALFPENGRQYAKCVCDCGEEYTGLFSHLQQGKVRSCGCIRRK